MSVSGGKRRRRKMESNGCSWSTEGPTLCPSTSPCLRMCSFITMVQLGWEPGARGGVLSLGKMNIPLEKLWVKAGGSYMWLELWGFWGADPNGCSFSFSCILDPRFPTSWKNEILLVRGLRG